MNDTATEAGGSLDAAAASVARKPGSEARRALVAVLLGAALGALVALFSDRED